jgi:hypothetical protein
MLRNQVIHGILEKAGSWMLKTVISFNPQIIKSTVWSIYNWKLSVWNQFPHRFIPYLCSANKSGQNKLIAVTDIEFVCCGLAPGTLVVSQC